MILCKAALEKFSSLLNQFRRGVCFCVASSESFHLLLTASKRPYYVVKLVLIVYRSIKFSYVRKLLPLSSKRCSTFSTPHWYQELWKIGFPSIFTSVLFHIIILLMSTLSSSQLDMPLLISSQCFSTSR